MLSESPIAAAMISTETLNQRSNAVLSTTIEPNGPKSLLFIDAGVAHADQLIATAATGTQVYVLGAGEGLDRITQVLSGFRDVASVQIVSHGRSGGLQLGASWLDVQGLPGAIGQLKSWRDSLTADADILLYGCNVARGELGQAFVNQLADLTGADIAASIDVTGNAALGGNWDLEYQTGAIDGNWAIVEAGLQSYSAVLDAILVKDIFPGAGFSVPLVLTNVNGTLYFVADDGTHGYELWKSDGTAAGTSMVKDIRSGEASSVPDKLTNVNGILYFRADDGTNGLELWKSDGTAAGTSMVKDILPGITNSAPDKLTNVNGTLYFTARDGNDREELWKSDGTVAGTKRVKDINSGGPSSPEYLANVNGTLYFSAYSETNGYGLWKSDGTVAGTTVVNGLTSVRSPYNLTNVNGTLYFVADNGNRTNDYELWKSDGTAAGTSMVKDIKPGTGSSNPHNLTNVNGTLYFVADDGTNGQELWKSDGTVAGTKMVKDTSPTEYFAPDYLTNVNGTLYFVDHIGSGNRLWKSDGTAAGTTLVKYSNLVDWASNLTNVDGTLYFTASDQEHGIELWKLAGTQQREVILRNEAAGTVMMQYYDGLKLVKQTSIYRGFVSDANLAIGLTVDWQIKATYDFNNDGNADVLWQQTSTGNIGVWEMNGNVITKSSVFTYQSNGIRYNLASLGNWEIIGLGNNQDSPVLFLQDRNNGEILTRHFSGYELNLTASGVVKTYLGVDLKPGADWKAIQLADFNNDRNTDVLFQSKTTGQLIVWNLKNDVLQSSASLGTLAPTGPWIVQSTGQLTKPDTQLDLLLYNKTTGGLVIDTLKNGQVLQETIALGTGNLNLGKPGKFNDLDGDGKTEAVWVNSTGKVNISRLDTDARTNTVALDTETKLTTLLPGWTVAAIDEFQTLAKTSNTKPTFKLITPVLKTTFNRTIVQQIVTDFNPGLGDGTQTLLRYNVSVLSGSGFIQPNAPLTLDNTGKLTLRTTSANTSGQIVLQITATDSGTGDNTSLAQTVTIDVSPTYAPQRQVIVRNEAAGTIMMQYYNGLEYKNSEFIYRGTISDTTVAVGLTADWQIKATKDFNNDGTTDMLWQQTSTGNTVIWEMSGNVIKRSSSLYTMTSPLETNLPTLGTWEILGLGTDQIGQNSPNSILMMQNRVNGELRTWQIVGRQVIRPADDGVIKTAMGQSFVPGSNWKVIQIADLNQDNSTDVVFQEKTTGQVVTWMLKNNVIQSNTLLGTLAPTGAWSIVGTGQDAPQGGFVGSANRLWLYNRITGEFVLDNLQNNQLFKSTTTYVADGNRTLGRPVRFAQLSGLNTLETFWINSTTGKFTIGQIITTEPTLKIAFDAETSLVTPLPGWTIAAIGNFLGQLY